MRWNQLPTSSSIEDRSAQNQWWKPSPAFDVPLAGIRYPGGVVQPPQWPTTQTAQTNADLQAWLATRKYLSTPTTPQQNQALARIGFPAQIPATPIADSPTKISFAEHGSPEMDAWLNQQNPFVYPGSSSIPGPLSQVWSQ